MLEVELKSNELKEYVYLELNKNKKDPIYDEDLNEITSLYLNKLDLIGEPTDITIYDLIFFKNLKECTISNMNISDKELAILNRLSNLESLQLNDCNFSNKTKVELNIKNLIINDCENVNISLYEDIKTLSRLQIANCKNINLKGISKLSNLSEILLQNISMNNIDEILGVKSLKKLNLNGSKIENLDKINKMPNLYIEHEEINGLYDEEY